MKLLSEFMGNSVKAAVFYRIELKDYIAVCYDERGFERFAYPATTEDEAEEYAEDYVS